jgi:hypothetical protein
MKRVLLSCQSRRDLASDPMRNAAVLSEAADEELSWRRWTTRNDGRANVENPPIRA